MLFSVHDILDLPVETQNGTHLGKIENVHVEIETQTIYQYQVKATGISHLFDAAELLIHRDQVISISEQKMIVEDSVRQAMESKKIAEKKTPQLKAAEAITRSSEPLN